MFTSSIDKRPSGRRPTGLPARRLTRLARGIINRALSFGLIAVVVRALDARDERRASGLRHEFGLRGCLLSWHREPDGRWQARLSGPDTPRTIERTGWTRQQAIARADRALDGIRWFRLHAGRRPGPMAG